MPTATRSSARVAANSSPKKDPEPTSPRTPKTGDKRKAESPKSGQSKRGRKASKSQSTIEEGFAKIEEKGEYNPEADAMDVEDSKESENPKDEEKATKPEKSGDSGNKLEPKEPTKESEKPKDGDKVTESAMSEDSGDKPEAKESTKEPDDAKKEDDQASNEASKPSQNDGAVQKSPSREKTMPSSILEKGIIYFFTRNRVGIEEAEDVGDLQRSFFVLRPLPLEAKLGDGALPDLKNNRLFALPKKTLPKTERDRFMTFVEKTNTSIQDLKENFFKGSEYETKTMGTRKVDPVTPVGEGVYAITRAEDTSTHMAYMLTIPSEPGELQKALGIKEKGSFLMSVKNPERSGPANLPKGPEYPKEIIEEFRGLAWASVQLKYLDYENTQILLIGEDKEGDLGKAVEQTHKDEKNDKDAPEEELETLEHEDELRVQHLNGDDSVFDDLRISKKEHGEVQTTW